VSLVPEMPGDLYISRDTLKMFQDDLAEEPFIPGRQGAFHRRVGGGVWPVLHRRPDVRTHRMG
jgi:hypothetical protein